MSLLPLSVLRIVCKPNSSLNVNVDLQLFRKLFTIIVSFFKFSLFGYTRFILFWAFEVPSVSITVSVTFQRFLLPKIDHFGNFQKLIPFGFYLLFHNKKMAKIIYFVQLTSFSMTFQTWKMKLKSSWTLQVFHDP